MSRVFEFHGRALDEGQRPVAGARVRLMPGNHSVTTAADGAFAFDGLASRRHAVSARKDDLYASAELVDPGDSGQPLILRMRLGATLIVHAFAERAPVAGAEIVLDETITAVTDATGTATVRGLAPGFHDGWLFADGWAQERISMSLHEDPGGVAERVVALHRGAPIEGVVLGALGRRVPDARIQLWSADHGRCDYEARSRADGTWRVMAGTGTYRVVAHSNRVGPMGNVTLDCDGSTPHRDVILRVGFASPRRALAALVAAGKRLATGPNATRIAGVVVDEGGAPASGAVVHVVKRSFATTDSRGRFELHGLDTREHEVTVAWSGQRRRPLDERIRKRVHTGDTNLTFVLAAGATVTGRAMLDGNPLPYYGVRVVSEREHARGGMPLGIQARDGRFTVRHVDPGTWRIALLGPGTRLVTSHEFTIEAGESIDLGDIAIARGDRISGHVRDRSGAPVAGARVITGLPSALAGQWSRLEQWFMAHYEAATDADGAYAFDGIDLELGGSAKVWATHVSAGVSVIRALPQTGATIDFTLLGAGAIDGVVQGGRGGHAMALAVRADEPPSSRLSSVDPQTGRFQFEDLPPGDYVVSLNVPKGEQVSSANVTVVPNQIATANLVMVSSSVQLTVKVPPGRSKDIVFEPTSSGAGVGSPRRTTMIMDEEESCRFSYVRPGDYRVSLDGTTWTPIVVPASPEEQTIDLR